MRASKAAMQRRERYAALILEGRFTAAIEAILAEEGIKPQAINSAQSTDQKMPAVDPDSVQEFILRRGISDTGQIAKQDKVLWHVIMYGTAENGAQEEGIAQLVLQTWRQDDVNKWNDREAEGVKMFGGRMEKLLVLNAYQGGNRVKDNHALEVVLSSIKPEKYARERSLTSPGENDLVAAIRALAPATKESNETAAEAAERWLQEQQG